MSISCAQREDRGFYSNRDKCHRKCCLCETENVFGMSEGIPKGKDVNFSIPEPPKGVDGDWELQYCQWSGWTWVKKDKTINQTNKDKKKKKGFLCFGGKNGDSKKDTDGNSKIDSLKIKNKHKGSKKGKKEQNDVAISPRSDEDYDDCCCCCCCCCCNQVCCGCCGDYQPERDKRRNSKTIETQTVKEVKEQATKMSEMHIPKNCNRKHRMCKCRCRRRMCCPCRQTCSYVHSPKNNQSEDDKSDKSYNEYLINYCLTRNLRKPSKIDFLNVNTTNFSTLHKSLDILLRNNINIMHLFDDNKKEMKLNTVPALSNATISCLSNDNLFKKSDQEHNSLLTAVCDAILSSHKFDNDRFSSRVQKGFDFKESHSSISSRKFLERILSDFSFPLTKSNDDFKDIGVQATDKKESCEPKKSYTKLLKNRSKILRTSRFPRKVEILKRIEGLRSGKCRRTRFKDKEVLGEKTAHENVNSKNLTEIFKTPYQRQLLNKLKTSDDVNAAPLNKISDVEKILTSFDYSTVFTNTLNSDQLKGKQSCSLENYQSLDATTPPFSDSEHLSKDNILDKNKSKINK